MMGRRRFTAMPQRQGGQVLIAIVLGGLLFGVAGSGGVLLFGGKTPHQMRKAVAAVEFDKEKNSAIDHTLKQIEKESKHIHSERKKFDREVFAALKNHDTPTETFRALDARADAINGDSSKALLDLRFMLREELTDEQWRILFPKPAAPTYPSS